MVNNASSVVLSKDGSVHVTDERINTITSIVGSMMAVLMSGLIIEKAIRMQSTWYQLVAVSIYVLGLVNLFIMSTLHHGLKGSPRVEKIFRTLDYTAIFWLIAGTITAFVALELTTSYGIAILACTWLIAGTGIVLRATLSRLPKHITNTLFITLGWLPALALIPHVRTIATPELMMLAIGGLIYSVGFVVYVLEKPNIIRGVFGFHEIWHILVVVASATHAILILRKIG
jgi:hemolysin III